VLRALDFRNCTDMFAPGVSIFGFGTRFKFNVALGGRTLVTTPHITGLIAYFLFL